MKCQKCGSENEGKSKFCAECGTKLKKYYDIDEFAKKYKKQLVILSIVGLILVVAYATYSVYNWNYHHDFTVENPNTTAYTSYTADNGYTVLKKVYSGNKITFGIYEPRMTAQVSDYNTDNLSEVLDKEMANPIEIRGKSEEVFYNGHQMVEGIYITQDYTVVTRENKIAGDEPVGSIERDPNAPKMINDVVVIKANDKIYIFRYESRVTDYTKKHTDDYARFISSFKPK